MRWWDLDAVVTLEHALFPGDSWPADLFWSELAGVPRTRHVLVAEIDGRLVGYAGLYATGSTADVQTIGVAPEAQGRGIGRTLIDALLAEARRRGCAAVLLEVRADNAPARALYERLGFEQLSVRRGYYDAGRTDALVLRLRLRAEAPDAVAGSRS